METASTITGRRSKYPTTFLTTSNYLFYISKKVALATIKKQEFQFKCVCHHLGKANLASITPAAPDDMYIAMLKGDTLSGKPSGGSYVDQIHDNITLVFARAVKEGILASNPCEAANPFKMDTKEKKALKPEKARELVEAFDPTRMCLPPRAHHGATSRRDLRLLVGRHRLRAAYR